MELDQKFLMRFSTLDYDCLPIGVFNIVRLCDRSAGEK